MREHTYQQGHGRSAPRPAGPYVSVVIPNLNGRRWLERCLGALRAQRLGDYEIILADNGSTDDSRDVAERCCPEVRWIGLPRNLGFAAAANAGIRAARGEFVALLNNDTEADPSWLEALVDALERRPDVAIAASRLRDDADRERLEFAGGELSLAGVPSAIGVGELDDGRFDEDREVFWACAGAALYRRSLFEEIGLFEESFFAYCEDVDLCFRAQLAGHRCLYVAAAVVYHARGGTAGRNNGFTTRLSIRNQMFLVVRNYPWPFLRANLRNVLYSQCYLTEVLRRQGQLEAALWAHASFLCHLPRALAARRRIQRRRSIDNAYLAGCLRPGEDLPRPNLPTLWRIARAAWRPGLRIARRGRDGLRLPFHQVDETHSVPP